MRTEEIFGLFDAFDSEATTSTDTEPREVYPDVTCPGDYPRLYYYVKNSLCGIGQNLAKRLLRKKQKEGDEIAGLYRAVLIAESSYAYYCKYMGNMRYDERYYGSYLLRVEDLVKACVTYNKQHPANPITIGYKPWACLAMECLLFIELPGMQPVSFYAYMELVESENIPLYEKEWDGIVNGNYHKIESAVLTRYADDIQHKRSQIYDRRRKMSCVSQGSLLNEYNIWQAIELITVQDTSGCNVTMNDVYQRCISSTLVDVPPTYVLCPGMYVAQIRLPKGWNGKNIDAFYRYLFQKLREKDWCIWTGMSSHDIRIDVVAYIKPIFNSEAEQKANIAVIYSYIMLALSDYMNIICDYVIENHMINVIQEHSSWKPCYSAIMMNGTFQPRTLLTGKDFACAEDYLYYIYSTCGHVNPHYKLFYPLPVQTTDIVTDDDVFDVDEWIAEAASQFRLS